MQGMTTAAAERNSEGAWLPPWTKLEHQARYDFVAPFVSGKRVVDCACGAGIGSVLFAANGALEVRAIDSSADAVDEARKADPRSNLQITRGDATNTGLSDGFADVFISLETIEHIKEDAAFIEEIFRVLKPGGMLICSTPNREITNPGASMEDAPWNPHHVREYNLPELRARLESRFEIQGVYGQNPVPAGRARLMRMLAQKVGTAWAIKLNKLLKCRWFLMPSPEHHAVRPVLSHLEYEFYVVVGRRPH